MKIFCWIILSLSTCKSFALGMFETKQLIHELYHNGLNRPADESGVAYFTNLLTKGGNVREVLICIGTSDEYFEKYLENRTQTEIIYKAYNTFLFRNPDGPGLEYWKKVLINDGFNAVLRGLVFSAEFNSKYPQFTNKFIFDEKPPKKQAILSYNSTLNTQDIKKRITISKPQINLQAAFSSEVIPNVNVILRNIKTGKVYDFKSNTLFIGDMVIEPGTYDFLMNFHVERYWDLKAVLEYE